MDTRELRPEAAVGAPTCRWRGGACPAGGCEGCWWVEAKCTPSHCAAHILPQVLAPEPRGLQVAPLRPSQATPPLAGPGRSALPSCRPSCAVS